MYKVKRIFTTKDGLWNRHVERYDIDPESARMYGSDIFTEKGCATCLFVKIEGGPASRVQIRSRDKRHTHNLNPTNSGWSNMPIFHSSAYNPDRGEQGPWDVSILDYPSEVVEGVGLPFSWHVSTFIVFGWEESEPISPTQPDPVEPIPQPDPSSGQWVQLYLDGILAFERNRPDGTS